MECERRPVVRTPAGLSPTAQARATRRAGGHGRHWRLRHMKIMALLPAGSLHQRKPILVAAAYRTAWTERNPHDCSIAEFRHRARRCAIAATGAACATTSNNTAATSTMTDKMTLADATSPPATATPSTTTSGAPTAMPPNGACDAIVTRRHGARRLRNEHGARNCGFDNGHRYVGERRGEEDLRRTRHEPRRHADVRGVLARHHPAEVIRPNPHRG